MAPLVEVRELEKRFTAGGAWLRDTLDPRLKV